VLDTMTKRDFQLITAVLLNHRIALQDISKSQAAAVSLHKELVLDMMAVCRERHRGGGYLFNTTRFLDAAGVNT
jgi:myo-inositol catabolism protein IolC